jgi:hypothetical protein
MSIIEKLTEGVVRRNTQKEGEALLNKWEKTGLLEGINSEHTRNGMAALLENQAKEILREASTMATGDVEGFAAVAFPIVRRVFGGLVANELVSVQPMSLPSGLIFFLDFTYGGNSDSLNLGGYTVSASVYGGGRIASQITAGVDLDGANAETSFYALNNGYASPVTQSATITNPTAILSGTVGSGTGDDANGALSKAVQFDADLSGSTVVVATMALSDLTDDQFNEDNFVTVTLNNATGRQVRRLTRLSGTSTTTLLVVLEGTGSQTAADLTASVEAANAATFVITDNFTNGALGGVVGTTAWALEQETAIPEIDIKVDSVSVTAITKKLKAKWTPELQQDINAYHNLDAEVELTSILSEQIALEIDQEIADKAQTRLFSQTSLVQFLNGMRLFLRQ